MTKILIRIHRMTMTHSVRTEIGEDVAIFAQTHPSAVDLTLKLVRHRHEIVAGEERACVATQTIEASCDAVHAQ